MPYKPIDDHTRANMLELLAQAGKLVATIKQLCDIIELAGAGIQQALEAQGRCTEDHEGGAGCDISFPCWNNHSRCIRETQEKDSDG